MSLLLGPFPLAFAEQARIGGPMPSAVVPLEVPTETPLRLYLTRRVWFHQGAPLTARVIDAVWAFDRVVIPAGTLVQGNIASFQKVSRSAPSRAMLGGDFTPLKRAELSFSSLEFTEGWQMPISVVPALGLDTIYVPKHARSTTRRRRVLRPSKDGLDLYNSGFANARPNGVGRNTLQGPWLHGTRCPLVA
jgi:hypothetical protein